MQALVDRFHHNSHSRFPLFLFLINILAVQNILQILAVLIFLNDLIGLSVVADLVDEASVDLDDVMDKVYTRDLYFRD